MRHKLLSFLVLSLAIIISYGQSNCSQVKLDPIPESAEIVFHLNNLVYVMDSDGGNRTQITFDSKSRILEHVAVSPDKKYIVANFYTSVADFGKRSKLVLFNLVTDTETLLLTNFYSAGNGGVDWDTEGRIYFAGLETLPFPNPASQQEFIANAGANDIYSVKFDATGLTRITNSPLHGESDVSVLPQPDGPLIISNSLAINPPNDKMEIWIYKFGNSFKVFEAFNQTESVHDPELSPDGTSVIFSMVNPNFKNFPDDPNANTAHDIYTIKLDGTGLTRLTEPGPISIVPDWKQDKILFLQMSSLWSGLIVMDSNGNRIGINEVNIAKWIP